MIPTVADMFVTRRTAHTMQKPLASLALAAGLLCAGIAQAAPSYLPSGPQTNVSLATVTSGGWTQCYVATFNVYIGDAGGNVLNPCQGDYIMMAGRETSSSNLLALAATTRADAILDTGNTNTGSHVSNGTQWWYSDLWSWGFAGVNDAINNGECNVGDGAISMCLHTVNNASGYRINNIQFLNDSTNYEKIFFVANRGSDVPEPGTLALVGLALAGTAGGLRRKSR
jgi:PEP-CTERM motif